LYQEETITFNFISSKRYFRNV